jgi:hypothetical protein
VCSFESDSAVTHRFAGSAICINYLILLIIFIFYSSSSTFHTFVFSASFAVPKKPAVLHIIMMVGNVKSSLSTRNHWVPLIKLTPSNFSADSTTLFFHKAAMNKPASSTRLLLLLLTLIVIGWHAKMCHGFTKTFVGSSGRTNNMVSSVSVPGRGLPLFASGLTSHELPIALDPSLEAEVLTGMVHVTMDFTGILFTPPRSMLRLFPVIGRIFAISADYIVDHSIHPEELMIQLFLICVALREYLSDPPSASNHTTK